MTFAKISAAAIAASAALCAPAFGATAINDDLTAGEMRDVPIRIFAPNESVTDRYTNVSGMALTVTPFSMGGLGNNDGRDLDGVTFTIDAPGDPYMGENVFSFDRINVTEGAPVPQSTGLGTAPGFTLGAGEAFTFTLSADPTADQNVGLNYGFETAAVPLPAGGVLLLTALAGGAAVTRRKKSA